eukprot:GHRR01006056.1.p1 GENE.GHRR01006056.1~~GHRR01006056.1.p1  ORF type:complete len:120 (-),score=25.21 GHRR01006056.1:1431-1790(-)
MRLMRGVVCATLAQASCCSVTSLLAGSGAGNVHRGTQDVLLPMVQDALLGWDHMDNGALPCSYGACLRYQEWPQPAATCTVLSAVGPVVATSRFCICSKALLAYNYTKLPPFSIPSGAD